MQTPPSRPRRLPGLVPLLAVLAPSAGVLAANSTVVAFSWFVLSRLAYVLFVGWSLLAQDGRGWYTRRYGAEDGYRRFRRIASTVMNNDAVAIGLVCWIGRGTFLGGVDPRIRWSAGLLMVAAGLGVKAWASRSLGAGGYMWKGSFLPDPGEHRVASGPYRWFRHPMYTVGYLHAYGAAVCLGSLAGALAAVIAQVLILAMNHVAERPRTATLRSGPASWSSPSASPDTMGGP